MEFKKNLLHFALKIPKCGYPREGLSYVPLMLLFPAWSPDGSQRGLRSPGCKGRTRTMSDLPSQAAPHISTPLTNGTSLRHTILGATCPLSLTAKSRKEESLQISARFPFSSWKKSHRERTQSSCK